MAQGLRKLKGNFPDSNREIEADTPIKHRNNAYKDPASNALIYIIYILLALHASYVFEKVTHSLCQLVLAFPRSDVGDLIRYGESEVNPAWNYSTLITHSLPGLEDWSSSSVTEVVPVVFYWGKPGGVPCSQNHHALASVQQALKLNSVVYFIGPPDCTETFNRLGVHYQSYDMYEDVYEWFIRNIGSPIDNHVRWFILKKFLEITDYNRVLLLNAEVMLYSNVTELAAWMYPHAHVVLPSRWPSLRPPLRENQYKSIAVGGHIALFSYEALSDWCLFLWQVFQSKLFSKATQVNLTDLTTLPEYSDMQALGLYTFSDCWLQNVDPPCLGISRDLAYELKQNFKPHFHVESFCQPRQCHNSTWSDEGECVWDNNFSLTTTTSYFRFKPGQKNPTSKFYSYYTAWTGRQQKQPIQFLGVHFHGKRKDFLTAANRDPEISWGSSRV